MKNMTLENIATAVSGQLIFPDCIGNEARQQLLQKEAQGLVIDNRKIEQDFIFVPIRGAKVDGHRFINGAIEAGALGTLSDHELKDAIGPYIVVENTEQALKTLAAFYRSQLTIPIIGIIGSVGKTSTKEMVASVLSTHYNVLKTDGNFNNEIGLPLTLFRIRPEHQVAVVEMGISDFGEMHRLGEMAKPTMVIMTNIGQCHLEFLKSRDGILKAKTEVFDHLTTPATVILNGDDDKLVTVKNVPGAEILYYGKENKESFARAIDVENLGLKGVKFTMLLGPAEGRSANDVTVPLPGEHNVYNALAAAAAGRMLGLSTEEIIRGIETTETISGRSNFIEANDMVIIDDCYNASPVSMKASLEILSHAVGRKIAVLGDMGELGTDEKALHYSVGEAVCANKIDILFTAGPLSKEIGRAVCNSTLQNQIANKKDEDDRPKIIVVKSYDTVDQMLPELLKTVRAGDTVLVKASHFMQFPKVVDALRDTSI